MKKKLIPFITAIVAVLLFAWLYTYKEDGSMIESGFLVNDSKILKALISGTAEHGDTAQLLQVTAGEPIYARGSARFVGEFKVRLNELAPMLVNDGAALMALDANGALIDTDLEYLPTYEGLYVSGGHSFNSDGMQADEEEFILYGLASGAAINVQPVDVQTVSGDEHIPMNSIMAFEAEEIRLYTFYNGELVYSIFEPAKDALITIGDNEYDYDDLLKRLGIITDELAAAQAVATPAAIEPSASVMPELTTPPVQEIAPGNVSGPAASGSPGPANTSEGTAVYTPDSGKQTPTPKPDDTKAQPSQPVNTGSQSVQGEGTGGNAPSEGSSQGGGQSTGSSGGGGGSSSSGSSTGTSSGGGSNQSTIRVPKITATNISSTVYTVSGEIAIDDPDGRLTKGVRILVYNDGKLIMRKTVKNSGAFTLGTLPPGAELQLEGTFEYLDENDAKRTSTFLEKTAFTTLDRSYLNDIDVSMNAQSEQYLPVQITIDGLAISEVMPAAEEPQAPDSVISYIARAVLHVEKTGGGFEIDIELDGATLGKLKSGASVKWMSPTVFESNSEYVYELKFYDRFGDEALSTQPSPVTGSASTCRKLPESRIKLMGNNIGSTVLNVSITDEDTSYVQGGESALRLLIYDEQGALVQNLKTQAGDSYDNGAIPLSVGNDQIFTITNLTANRQYSAVVMCPCDVLDGGGTKESEIGRTSFYTASISTLGYAYFNAAITNITSSGAQIDMSLLSRTNPSLRSLIDTFTYTVSDSEDTKLSFAFEKNARDSGSTAATYGFYSLDAVALDGVSAGEEYSMLLMQGNEKEPSVRIYGTASKDNPSVWDELISCSGSVELKLPTGTLKSASIYTLTVPVTVDQGGVRQSVTNPYTVATFRTMRLTPCVESDTTLAAENFFEIYGLNINDPDGAIKGDKLYAKLIKTSNEKVIDIQTINTNTLYETLRFSGLEKGAEYRVEFVCIEYNESFQQSTVLTQYVLPDKFIFTTGLSVTGSLKLEALDYSNPGDTVQMLSANIYNPEETQNGMYMNTNFVSSANSTYALSGFIPVEAGESYALSNFGSTTAQYTCFFYKADKTKLKWGYYLAANGVLTVPEGAVYLRINMNPAYIETGRIQKMSYTLEGYDLIDDTTWTQGYYTSAVNGNLAANSSYMATDYIAVEPGATYLRPNTAENLSKNSTYGSVVAFYDSARKFISAQYSGSNGGIVNVPSSASYIRTYYYKGQAEFTSLYKVLPGSGSESMIATMRAQVNDPQNALSYDGSEYILKVTDKFGLTTEFEFDTPMDADGNSLDIDELCPINVASGNEYTVELAVKMQGKYDVVLDSTSFKTQNRITVIRNEAELRAITADPYGSYVVVNDIRMKSAARVIENFYGTLDFNGHTVTAMPKASYLIGYLMEGATLRNLVMEYDIGETGDYIRPVTVYNYGLISNVIVKFSGSPAITYRQYMSGLAQTNYKSGVIENFVIKFETPIYYGAYFGGAVYANSGTVRNGYVYGEDIYVSSGSRTGNAASSRAYVGALVARNYMTGTVKDVYSLVDIRIENGVSTNYAACMVGHSAGQVSNSFMTGDRYVYELSAETNYQPVEALNLTAGPAVGVNNAVNRTRELYYISDNDYTATFNTKASSLALWDSSWYEQIIDRDEQFVIEQCVSMGYYPQVQMNACMMAEQELIALPTAVKPQTPQLVTAIVTEQTQEYAEVLFSFANPQKHSVSAITLNGASVQLYTDEGSQYYEGDLYRVKGRVYAPTLYRDGYVITTSTSEWQGLSVVAEYGDAAGAYEPVTVPVSFYKLLYTSSDWTSIQSDMAGNYRLGANIDLSDRVPSMLQISNFTGKLDGGIYDGEGNLLDMYTIYGANSGVSAYVIYGLTGGELCNLKIDGCTLGNASRSSYCGFIAIATNGIINNVHITGMVNNPSSYGGTLAAHVTGMMITNCSATDCVTTTQPAGQLYVGGLVGCESTGCAIMNCFVQGMKLTAREGAGAVGIGGVVGYPGYGAILTNCIAQGTISSAFPYTGGIMGYCDGAYGNFISNVDITSTTGSFGGVVGNCFSSRISNTLILGDLYAINSEENIGRVHGSVRSASLGTGAYAYANQLYINDVSDDRTMVNGLLTSDELMQQSIYDDLIALGTGFDTSVVDDGYLPQVLSTEGTAFVNQRLIPVPVDSVRIAALTGSQNTGDNSGYMGEATYTVAFELYHEGYRVTDISVEGMEFVGVDGYPTDYTKSIDGFNVNNVREGVSVFTISRYYPNEKRKSYRLTVTLESDDGAGRIVRLSAKIRLDSPPYHTIANAQDWQEQMRLYGSSYEDFVITGDVDFSTLTEPVVMNVKVGSITGKKNNTNGAPVSIKNLDYTVMDHNDALICEVAGEMTYIDFENIDWNCMTKKKGGTSIGLVGTLAGRMSNVTFTDIELDSYTAARAGMIGTLTGTVENIVMTDVRHVSSSSGSYKGLLVGYAIIGSKIQNITITGSDSGEVNDNGQPLANTYINIPKSNAVGLVAGYSVGSITNASVGTEGEGAPRIVVTGLNYVGAVLGQSYNGSYTRYATVNNAAVTATSTRAGGVCGYYGALEYCTVRDCTIKTESGYGAGGIGAYLCTGAYNYVYDSEISAKTYAAGGIFALRCFNMKNSGVYNCTISAGTYYAGGALGSCTEYTSTVYTDIECYNNTVTAGTYGAGGIVGHGSAVRNSVSYNNTVTAGTYGAGGILGVTAGSLLISNDSVVQCEITASEYAGGIIGYSTNAGAERCYVRDSYIHALTNGAGGIAGYQEGATHKNCFVNASIESDGVNAGGLFGEVKTYGYLQNSGALTVQNCAVYADITAADNAGGLGGSATRTFDSDPVGFDDDKLTGTLIIATVMTTGATDAVDGGQALTGENIGLVCGVDSSGSPQNAGFTGVVAYENSSLNGAAVDPVDVTCATSETLAQTTTYSETLGWNLTNAWSATGLIADGTGTTEGAKYGTLPFVRYNFVNNNTEKKYLPLPGQRGISFTGTAALGTSGRTVTVLSYGEDDADGIPVPTFDVPVMAAFSLRGEAVTLGYSIYASGADTVNIEFDSSVPTEPIDEADAVAYFDIEDSEGNVLATHVVDRRVFTLTYDFETDLVFNLYTLAGETSEPIYANSLRSTVLTWGEDYYYISASGIQGSRGALSGDFVNIMKGRALTSTGALYDLADGETIRESTEIALTTLRPLFTTQLGEDTSVYTFNNFTIIKKDAQESVSEVRLAAKAGELRGVDTSELAQTTSFVLDALEDTTYELVLLDSGEVLDYGTAATTLPEDMRSFGIVQTSCSIGSDSTVMLLRYDDGSAAGFDYATGEVLSLDAPATDASLITYIAGYFKAAFAAEPTQLAEGYQRVSELSEQLEVMPFEGSVEGAYSNGLSELESAEGAESEPNPPDMEKSEGDGAITEGTAGENGPEDGGTNGTASTEIVTGENEESNPNATDGDPDATAGGEGEGTGSGTQDETENAGGGMGEGSSDEGANGGGDRETLPEPDELAMGSIDDERIEEEQSPDVNRYVIYYDAQKSDYSLISTDLLVPESDELIAAQKRAEALAHGFDESGVYVMGESTSDGENETGADGEDKKTLQNDGAKRVSIAQAIRSGGSGMMALVLVAVAVIALIALLVLGRRKSDGEDEKKK